MNKRQAHSGSFRDPAGFIFNQAGIIYRQVNESGQADYDLAVSSGLYNNLIAQKLIVGHQEVKPEKNLAANADSYKIIRPEAIPFISYPYEWTFTQLRNAALLTLNVLKTALNHGMILKDASAYNVQFIGNRPIFIDTLSFTKYETGDPWEGYKQFCEHFIAPLALAHYGSPGILKTLRVYLDGIPLAAACSLLPKKARWRKGLLAHLYLHNASQRRHQAGGQAIASKAKQHKLSKIALQGLLSSLEHTVQKLRPPKTQTEWGEYYNFTNYSSSAFEEKKKTIKGLLRQIKPIPKVAWDIGANNGEFSEIAAELGAYTVAFDIDELAVSRNYLIKRKPEIKAKLLPLVQDLTNPSPGLGWDHTERSSLVSRGPADVVLALALIHHLAIGNNLPLSKVAAFLHRIGKHIIIEFVPKEDSKVQHLLASRKDIFSRYDAEHFEAAMAEYFTLITKKPVKGSKRSVYLYKAKT